MKKTNVTVLILILALLTLALAMASSAFAEEPPAAEDEAVAEQPPRVRDWILRFGFVVAETDGTTSVAADPGSVDIRLSGGGGGFVGLERKVTPRIGIEFSTTGIGADMDVSTHTGHKHIGSDVDVLGMGALTLGANFHLVANGALDVYAGPMLSYNRFSKWSVHSGVGDGCWPAKHGDCWVSARLDSDSELSWGAKAGIDLFLNKKKSWTLGCSLTYIDATYDFEDRDGGGRGSFDLDPLMFGFGAGFRF